MEGPASLVYSNKSKVLGTFSRGVLHGPASEYWHKNVTTSVGLYNAGKRTGWWREYIHKVSVYFHHDQPLKFLLQEPKEYVIHFLPVLNSKYFQHIQ